MRAETPDDVSRRPVIGTGRRPCHWSDQTPPALVARFSVICKMRVALSLFAALVVSGAAADTPQAEQKTTLCYSAAAVRLDDYLSDAMTIARAVSFNCRDAEREQIKSASLHLQGNEIDNIHAQSINNFTMRALGVVLVMRVSAKGQKR